MIKIIPGILEERYSEIENKINMAASFSTDARARDEAGEYVEESNTFDEENQGDMADGSYQGHRHDIIPGQCNLVQIDVCDGVFTPKPTWPFVHGIETDIDFKGLITEKMGLPHWEDIDIEIDLMCAHPLQYVERFIRMGASKIIVHKDAAPKEEIKEALELIQSFGVEAYLGLPATQHVHGAQEIQELLQVSNGVQIMGVSPGAQGQSFNPESVKTAHKIKEGYPDLHIQIDGSENEETIPQFIDVGIDTFVVGSALYGNEDPIGEYEFLSSLE
jgi:ribulose-phosphate 3-epimerase